MAGSTNGRDSPRRLRKAITLIAENISDIVYMVSMILVLAIGIASNVPGLLELSPAAGNAMILGALVMLTIRMLVHDLKSDHAGTAVMALIEELRHRIILLTAALAAQRDDICSRPNEPSTFRHMSRRMLAYRPRFPIEGWVDPVTQAVVLKGAAINMIVDSRCREDTPFEWILAVSWNETGQPLFGETLRERQRIAATLFAIHAVAATRPGHTTERIHILKLPEQLNDHTTAILTHHDEFDRDLIVMYRADARGYRHGTNAPPRDVILDPRPYEIELFKARWAEIEKTCERVTIAQFIADALPLFDNGVYIDLPTEVVATGDHFAIPDAERICLYAPKRRDMPAAAADDAASSPPPATGAGRA